MSNFAVLHQQVFRGNLSSRGYVLIYLVMDIYYRIWLNVASGEKAKIRKVQY